MKQKKNYRQIFAIKKSNEQRILRVCPNCPNTSGIYFFLREENGFKFGYIGKAKHLLERLCSHLSGRKQWIDLSILKHGLYSDKNPAGYKIHFLEYPESALDEMEQKYIKQYANAGYQLRNVESGGNEGKTDIGDRKPSKGYHDGLKQGFKNAQKEVSHLFKLHLDFTTKKQPATKIQEKAYNKFKDFISEE
jgi:hypothetical protein